MQRKHVSYMIAGCMLFVFILMMSLNVMAAYDGGSQIPFSTDKSDRTILKEIIVNQQKTHAILKDIKTLLQEAK